jgi:hypothetical protein
MFELLIKFSKTSNENLLLNNKVYTELYSIKKFDTYEDDGCGSRHGQMPF